MYDNATLFNNGSAALDGSLLATTASIMISNNSSEQQQQHIFNEIDSLSSSNSIIGRLQNYSSSNVDTTGEQEETFTSLSFEEELFWIFIYLPMIAVAAGGNTIVIYTVIANREMKSVTNYFLVNLSFADTMVSTLNVIFNFISMLNSHWPFGAFYCRVSNFIAILSISASVFTLTAISCDRYNAIIHPLKPRMSHRAALGWIIAIWSLSILLASPNQIYSDTIEEKLSNGEQSRVMCAIVWPDGMTPNSSMDHIYNVIILIVTYVVPIVTMALLYYKVGIELWGSQAIGENTDKQLKGILAKKKIVKMMIVVVTIFALCWFPYHAVFVAGFYGHRTDQRTFLLLYWLAMSNSMYNPIIIYFMNSKFRRGFKQVFCCLCYGGCNNQDTQQTGARNQYSVGVGLYSNYRASRNATKTLFTPNTNNNVNNNNNNNSNKQRGKSFALGTSSSKQNNLKQEAPLLTNQRNQKPISRHLMNLVPKEDDTDVSFRQDNLIQVHCEHKNIDHHDVTTINETTNNNQPMTKLASNKQQQQQQSQSTVQLQTRDFGEKESHYLVSVSEPTSTHSNVTTTTCPSSASSLIPLNSTIKTTLTLKQTESNDADTTNKGLDSNNQSIEDVDVDVKLISKQHYTNKDVRNFQSSSSSLNTGQQQQRQQIQIQKQNSFDNEPNNNLTTNQLKSGSNHVDDGDNNHSVWI